VGLWILCGSVSLIVRVVGTVYEFVFLVWCVHSSETGWN
jgi:hypothetical protein